MPFGIFSLFIPQA